MTDPYQPQNPYGQQNPYGPNPYGGSGRPDYGPGQGDPYAAGGYGQPAPYGQGAGQPGQPGQPGPPGYGGQPQPDPYATRQYEPGFGQPDPYGQYQGSYGQPAWGGGGGELPPTEPRKSKAPVIVTSVLAVLVIIGAVIVGVVVLRGDDSQQATPPVTNDPTTTTPATTSAEPTSPPTTDAEDKVFTAGECASLIPEDDGRARLNTAECGSQLSDVLVAKVQDSTDCGDADYIRFTADVGKIYCLAVDANEGDCFEFDQLPKRATSCQGEGTYEAVQVFEGVTDPPRCRADEDSGDRVYSYSEPARTLCFTPTSGT